MFLERYGAIAIRPISRRARRLLALGRRPGGRRLGGDVAAGRSPERGRLTASGFELGVAGIAWVNLQASRATGDRRLPRACAPGRKRGCGASPIRGRRLGGAARRCRPPRHVGLDSGAAGIGWVLEDLGPRGHRHGREPRCRTVGARGLRAEARHDRLRGVLVRRTGPEARRRLRAEPSWHWGAAGIAAFAARLAGWVRADLPAGRPASRN